MSETKLKAQAINDSSVDETKIKNTVMCRAYLNSAQDNITNGAVTLVNLDAETFDLGSNFNTSTHLFTCPYDGYYEVTVLASFSSAVADKYYTVGIGKNGSVVTWFRNGCNGAWASTAANGTDILSCSATNTIGCYVYLDAGASTVDLITSGGCFMSVRYLGTA